MLVGSYNSMHQHVNCKVQPKFEMEEDIVHPIKALKNQINAVNCFLEDKYSHLTEAINQLKIIEDNDERKQLNAAIVDFLKVVQAFENNIRTEYELHMIPVLKRIFPILSKQEDPPSGELIFLDGDSPWEFTLTSRTKDEIKETMKKFLSEYLENNILINIDDLKLKPGKLMLCFLGESFFRGIFVQNTHCFMLYVYDIDDSIYRSINKEFVFEMPADLMLHPPQAIRCSLIKESRGRTAWNESMNIKFRQIFSQFTFSLNIVDEIALTYPPRYLVELISYRMSKDLRIDVKPFSTWFMEEFLPYLIECEMNPELVDEDVLNPYFWFKDESQFECDDVISMHTNEPTSSPESQNQKDQEKINNDDTLALSKFEQNMDHVAKCVYIRQEYSDNDHQVAEEAKKIVEDTNKTVLSHSEFGNTDLREQRPFYLDDEDYDDYISDHEDIFVCQYSDEVPISKFSNKEGKCSKLEKGLACCTRDHVGPIDNDHQVAEEAKKIEDTNKTVLSHSEFGNTDLKEQRPFYLDDEDYDDYISYYEDIFVGNARYSDEVPICKFSNKEGKCSKLEKGLACCTRDHVGPIGKGFLGCVYTFSQCKKLLELPEQGSKINILPVNIVNGHLFFAHLKDDNEDNPDKLSLKMMEKRLNNYCEWVRYEMLDLLPTVGELVVARNSANFWIRARVIDVFEHSVRVVNIDYGTEENILMSNIRKINFDMLFLAPQAVRCVLHGIVTHREKRKEATEFLKNNIFNQLVRAEINVCDQLEAAMEITVLAGGKNMNELMVQKEYCFSLDA